MLKKTRLTLKKFQEANSDIWFSRFFPYVEYFAEGVFNPELNPYNYAISQMRFKTPLPEINERLAVEDIAKGIYNWLCEPLTYLNWHYYEGVNGSLQVKQYHQDGKNYCCLILTFKVFHEEREKGVEAPNYIIRWHNVEMDDIKGVLRAIAKLKSSETPQVACPYRFVDSYARSFYNLFFAEPLDKVNDDFIAQIENYSLFNESDPEDIVSGGKIVTFNILSYYVRSFPAKDYHNYLTQYNLTEKATLKLPTGSVPEVNLNIGNASAYLTTGGYFPYDLKYCIVKTKLLNDWGLSNLLSLPEHVDNECAVSVWGSTPLVFFSQFFKCRTYGTIEYRQGTFFRDRLETIRKRNFGDLFLEEQAEDAEKEDPDKLYYDLILTIYLDIPTNKNFMAKPFLTITWTDVDPTLLSDILKMISNAEKENVAFYQKGDYNPCVTTKKRVYQGYESCVTVSDLVSKVDDFDEFFKKPWKISRHLVCSASLTQIDLFLDTPKRTARKSKPKKPRL